MTTDNTELALVISKAKASVFTLEYISQFEPADIDSDDVDLRFEVDGRDTGTNVSIVDECGQAARVIGELVEALEKAQTINAAAEKLVRCKGRYHSEQNYRALAALFGVTTPDLPPLDGEPVVPDAETVYARLSDHEKWSTSLENVKYVLNACRAAMLQAAPSCTCPSGDGSLRWPCPVHTGNSPVIPEGYVMVPMRLTAENGAKGALSGAFSETKFVNCPECFGDDECETCDGSGRIEITVPVTWTTIKEIWAKGVEHFAAAPQEVKGE